MTQDNLTKEVSLEDVVNEIAEGLRLEIETVRVIIEGILKRYLVKIKAKVGNFPTKEIFLKALSKILGNKVPLGKIQLSEDMNPIFAYFANFVVDSVKTPIVYSLLVELDEKELSKLLGNDWWNVIIKQIEAL